MGSGNRGGNSNSTSSIITTTSTMIDQYTVKTHGCELGLNKFQ